ncbi:uncharacterized protein LOC144094509 [Amblyomma americanum]
MGRTLLCTVGKLQAATIALQIPPDGLCDLVFYTNVKLRHWSNGSQAITANRAVWIPFRRAAADAELTGYGISFPQRIIENTTKYLDSVEATQQVQSLLKANIQNFGMLALSVNSKDYRQEKQKGRRLFEVVKSIQQRLPSEQRGRRRERVLGLAFRSYRDDRELSRHPAVMEDLSASFDITIFISLTHVRTWTQSRLAISGTIWSSWTSSGSRLDEVTLKSTAEHLKAANISDNITTLASYTLGAGRFSHREHATEDDRLSTATGGQEVAFTEYCNKKYTHDYTGPGKIRIAGSTDHTSITFEDSATMKVKADKFFEIYRHEMQGWALFDADFDDFNNSCGLGAFHRIREFKSFLAARLVSTSLRR